MSGDPTTTKRITQSSVLSPQSLIIVAGSVGAVLAAGLCAAGEYREATAAALVALIIGLVFSANISISTILVYWFVLTPIASFYIRFPLDKSVITFNRAVFALIAVLLLSRMKTSTASSAPDSSGDMRASRSASLNATPFEIAWAFLSVAALTSALLNSHDIGYAIKIAIDSFWLPLFAFGLARHHFADRANLRGLALGAIALAGFLLATGAFEMTTGTDLFAYKGSELVRAGERRVNGMFASDSSYAIICLMLFVFLRAAPEALRVRFDSTSRFLYQCAIAAAAIAALLPKFRTVAIALLACWLMLELSAGKALAAKGVKPLAGRWLVPALIAIALLGATFAPALLARRITDPRNVFSRVATWEAAAAMAFEHPLFGVGLANYGDYFQSKYESGDHSLETVMDARALSSPHSNFMWIAAELGAVAFGFYLIANVYLALMGWRALKRARSRAQTATAACFLALAVAYWIPGLTLTSGAYSDLNLYFFFLLGVLRNRFESSAV